MPKVVRLAPMSHGNVLAHYEDGSSSVIPFGASAGVKVGDYWPPLPKAVVEVLAVEPEAPKTLFRRKKKK